MNLRQSKRTIPKVNATWAEFIGGFPLFAAAISDGLDCIVELSRQAAPTDKVATALSMLTHSIALNLGDVVFMCSHDRKAGALRLIRTPFEKFLYADHISKHPVVVEDFLMFQRIQQGSIRTAIAEEYALPISENIQPVMERWLAQAKTRFKREKCPRCGQSSPRSWTKVLPQTMAIDAGLRKEYVLVYKYSSQHIHPSEHGMRDEASGQVMIPSLLSIVHVLVTRTLYLQWAAFHGNSVATGRTAYVLTRLCDVFGTLDPPIGEHSSSGRDD